MHDAPTIRAYRYCGNCGESTPVARLTGDDVCADCALAVALDDGDLARAAALCADFDLVTPDEVALFELDGLIAERQRADVEHMAAAHAAEQ